MYRKEKKKQKKNKLGFRGVYNIFLISAQKHRLWVPTILRQF